MIPGRALSEPSGGDEHVVTPEQQPLLSPVDDRPTSSTPSNLDDGASDASRQSQHRKHWRAKESADALWSDWHAALGSGAQRSAAPMHAALPAFEHEARDVIEALAREDVHPDTTKWLHAYLACPRRTAADGSAWIAAAVRQRPLWRALIARLPDWPEDDQVAVLRRIAKEFVPRAREANRLTTADRKALDREWDNLAAALHGVSDRLAPTARCAVQTLRSHAATRATQGQSVDTTSSPDSAAPPQAALEEAWASDRQSCLSAMEEALGLARKHGMAWRSGEMNKMLLGLVVGLRLLHPGFDLRSCAAIQSMARYLVSRPPKDEILPFFLNPMFDDPSSRHTGAAIAVTRADGRMDLVAYDAAGGKWTGKLLEGVKHWIDTLQSAHGRTPGHVLILDAKMQGEDGTCFLHGLQFLVRMHRQPQRTRELFDRLGSHRDTDLMPRDGVHRRVHLKGAEAAQLLSPAEYKGIESGSTLRDIKKAPLVTALSAIQQDPDVARARVAGSLLRRVSSYEPRQPQQSMLDKLQIDLRELLNGIPRARA